MGFMDRPTLARQMLLAGSDAARWIMRKNAEGTISPDDYALIQKGADHWLRAIAEGDCAPREVVDHRLRGHCYTCPARTGDPDDPRHLGYCGPAFAERLDGPVEHRYCGCPIGPAAHVASRGCPREHFPAVDKTGTPLTIGATNG